MLVFSLRGEGLMQDACMRGFRTFQCSRAAPDPAWVNHKNLQQLCACVRHCTLLLGSLLGQTCENFVPLTWLGSLPTGELHRTANEETAIRCCGNSAWGSQRNAVSVLTAQYGFGAYSSTVHARHVSICPWSENMQLAVSPSKTQLVSQMKS